MKPFAFSALVAIAAAISTNDIDFVNYTARFNKDYEDVVEYATR